MTAGGLSGIQSVVIDGGGELLAVDPDALAQLLGVGAPGAIRRRGVADLLRAMVSARRAVSERFLTVWAAAMLSRCGLDAERSSEEVEAVLGALIEVGDLGRGELIGENVIVSVEPFAVALPDGSFALVGDHPGVDESAAADDPLRRNRRPPTDRVVDFLDFIGPSPLSRDEADTWAAWLTGTSDGAEMPSGQMPSPLKRALLLCGEMPATFGERRVSEQTAEFLTSWLGSRHMPENDLVAMGPVGPDPSQQRVIEKPAGARIVVEAGPGSGKTYVACRRAAHLVQHDVSPSRIWLLSFTRVAVAEMRQRIADALDDRTSAASINICTFDSLVGRVNAGFGGATAVRGYDAAVRDATRLLESDDPGVLDYMRMIEHVIIDEAQDLVGTRRRLVTAFINALNADCGVTVFGDFAQAIYGFQERHAADRAPGGFLDALPGGDAGFERLALEVDHRTRSESLRTFFAETREILRRGGDPAETHAEVEERLMAVASEVLPNAWEQRAWSPGDLVLHRSHRALLDTSQRLTASGIPHRTKLPGRIAWIEPWVGAVLAGQSADAVLSERDFRRAWDEVWPAPPLPVEDGWREVVKLAGERGSIRVSELAEALQDGAPPSLLRDHDGERGPLLGTIHSAKGREADRVVLVLPRRHPAMDEGDPESIEEESRVLYVGATRAKRILLIARARRTRLHRLSSGRHWRATAAFQGVEVGLDGDADPPASLPSRPDPDMERLRRDTIWRSVEKPLPASATRSGVRWMVHLTGADAARPEIATLSEAFVTDLLRLPGREGPASLPDTLTDFQVIGCATEIVGHGRAARPALVPRLGGFATVSRI